MKHLVYAALLMLGASFAIEAYATPPKEEKPPAVTPPPPSPPATPASPVNAGADARAGAAAGAVAGAAVVAPIDVDADSVSKSKAKSGDVTNEIGGDTVNSRSKSWAFGIVLPKSSPDLAPMAKIDCPAARIEQNASTGWGWGVTPGTASSSTNPIACERVTLINAKIETCQDASAQEMMDFYAEEIFKGYKAKTYDAKYNDPPDTCRLRKELWRLKQLEAVQPKAPVTNHVYNDYTQKTEITYEATKCPVPPVRSNPPRGPRMMCPVPLVPKK